MFWVRHLLYPMGQSIRTRWGNVTDDLCCKTNSQTINLLQDKIVAFSNLNMWKHLQKTNSLCLQWCSFWLDGKYCGNFSPFPIMFSMGFFLWGVKIHQFGEGLHYLVFFLYLLNSLPNNKIWDLTKLKAFADNLNIEKMTISLFDKSRKQCGKRRKCWLPAFSPCPRVFSTAFFFRVIISWDCVVRS